MTDAEIQEYIQKASSEIFDDGNMSALRDYVMKNRDGMEYVQELLHFCFAELFRVKLQVKTMKDGHSTSDETINSCLNWGEESMPN